MKQPNVIINFPMSVEDLVKLTAACPKDAIVRPGNDSSQVFVYFDAADAQESEVKGEA